MDIVRTIIATAALWVGCALALTGCQPPVEKLWEYWAAAPCYSSPAVGADLIVFGSENGEVHAVDKQGKPRWKFAARKDVVSAPAIAGNRVYFGSTNHNFYALDLDGKEVWKFAALDRIKSDPLIVDDAVVFSSYDDRVYALRASDRATVWIFPARTDLAATSMATSLPSGPPTVAEIKPGDFSYSSPLRVGDDIVLGNLDGHLYGIDFKSGHLAWRFATDGAASKQGVTSSPALRDGILYFGANDGNVYALEAASRRLRWKFKTEDEVNGAPAVSADGIVYIGGTDRHLYALDAATGALRWKFPTLGPVMTRPALYQNLVIFGGGSDDQQIYLVDRMSGQLFWSYKTGYKIEGDPVVDGNVFYIPSGDRKLYAFRINRTAK
jgi:eukaryotic-like serine/threonine-protein kinase